MTLAIPLKNTIVALRQLHLLPSNLILPSIFCYKPEHTYVLDRTLFAQALLATPLLFSSELFGMVYKHLLRCFIPEDPSSGFSELFQAIIIVVCGDIPRSMVIV
jgi:hypothetical protein